MFAATRSWLLFPTLVMAVVAICPSAIPQDFFGPRTVNPWERRVWHWYDPHFAAAARIWAQSEVIRAHGEVAVDLAEARNLHAEAVDKELDNWVKHVRAYWERRHTRERELLELERLRDIRNQQHLNDQKIRNSRVWDRLKNHPELTGPGVAQGQALNFLLDRLAGTALAYEFVRESGEHDREMLAALKLDENQLEGLNLRQAGTSGDQIVFGANQSSGIRLEWWPYILRFEEFDVHRARFEQTREKVLSGSDTEGSITVENLQTLETALMELTRQFYEFLGREDLRTINFRRSSQLRSAEAFLRNLDRELARLQRTGDMRVLNARKGYDPKRDGDNLVALLTYMNRQGLEFAPATPGNEPVYHTVFGMMRDVYLTVTQQDESVQPIDLRELIE